MFDNFSLLNILNVETFKFMGTNFHGMSIFEWFVRMYLCGLAFIYNK